MSDWTETTVGELAEVYDGPHATPKKTNSGPWFLSISSLRGGRLDLSESAHLSDDDYREWTRRVTPNVGDVLFSYETRLGEAALMPPNLHACLGRRMGLLRPKLGHVDPRFLLYFYLGPEFQRAIKERTIHGATVDRISIADLPSWPIAIPSIVKQRAIAEVLGALDDKIAVNDRIRSTAFNIATAMFRATVKSAGKEVRLGDIIELKYGRSLPARNRIDGPARIFGSGGVCGLHNEALVEGPGVIVGRKGTVGSVYWSEHEFFPIDTTFYVTRRIESIPLEFIFFLLRSLSLGSRNSDSAVPGLNRANALEIPVCVPHDNDLRAFGAQVRPIFELYERVSCESSALAALRDALLPKLMSGEIRVRGAEKAVEDAL